MAMVAADGVGTKSHVPWPLGSEGWPGMEAESPLLDYVAQDSCLLTRADGHGLGFLALC